MKWPICCFTVLFTLVVSASAQETQSLVPVPTPTLEQCKLDLASWRTATETYKMAKMSFEMLHARDKEVLYCEIEYPDAPDQPIWQKVGCQIHSDMEQRFRDFLDRHKLWNQFLGEDEEAHR